MLSWTGNALCFGGTLGRLARLRQWPFTRTLHLGARNMDFWMRQSKQQIEIISAKIKTATIDLSVCSNGELTIPALSPVGIKRT
jgi:hypothetical protein